MFFLGSFVTVSPILPVRHSDSFSAYQESAGNTSPHNREPDFEAMRKMQRMNPGPLGKEALPESGRDICRKRPRDEEKLWGAEPGQRVAILE